MHKNQPAGTISKNGHLITSTDEWLQYAAPKHVIHWKDGRSAKENARAWAAVTPNLQPDIAQVLKNCPDIAALRSWHAEPEARVPIDRYRGEQPNIDLLLVARDDLGPMVVAIEAKADEPFGDTLAVRCRNAETTLAKNPRSKALARLEELTDRFGLNHEHPQVPQLRYQLLTATAAALEEAKRRFSQRAILLVHELATPLTDPLKRERNASDLNQFLHSAFGFDGKLAPGNIIGPFHMNSAPRLYVGKARTVV